MSESILQLARTAAEMVAAKVDVYGITEWDRLMISKSAAAIESVLRDSDPYRSGFDEAANICAEMAQDAATQMAKFENGMGSEQELEIADRYKSMSQALREAERRIRLLSKDEETK